jgi:hypothetical protein
VAVVSQTAMTLVPSTATVTPPDAVWLLDGCEHVNCGLGAPDEVRAVEGDGWYISEGKQDNWSDRELGEPQGEPEGCRGRHEAQVVPLISKTARLTAEARRYSDATPGGSNARTWNRSSAEMKRVVTRSKHSSSHEPRPRRRHAGKEEQSIRYRVCSDSGVTGCSGEIASREGDILVNLVRANGHDSSRPHWIFSRASE